MISMWSQCINSTLNFLTLFLTVENSIGALLGWCAWKTSVIFWYDYTLHPLRSTCWILLSFSKLIFTLSGLKSMCVCVCVRGLSLFIVNDISCVQTLGTPCIISGCTKYQVLSDEPYPPFFFLNFFPAIFLSRFNCGSCVKGTMSLYWAVVQFSLSEVLMSLTGLQFYIRH